MTKKLWISISLIIIVAVLFAVFILRSINMGEHREEERLVVASPHPTQFMIPLIQEFENEEMMQTLTFSGADRYCRSGPTRIALADTGR